MPWSGWTGMDRLLDVLGAEDGETRVVGGAVRDTLLGMAVSDVDLATRFVPAEVLARLDAGGIKAVPTGLAHGTVTAVIGGRPVEVTTLRRDVATDGRHAVVAFTDDWRDDARRRDFTINALYADPLTGDVFDYHDGLADIADRRVRFIGDPLARIAEDHLRILRFFRFHARFGTAAPDAEGLAACTARVNDLMALSRERVADELLKLLGLPDPTGTLRIMLHEGIFAPVIPEIAPDAADRLHDLITQEARYGVAVEPLRRLATMLPADRRVADDVAARLRMSKAARARVACAAGRTPADATVDPRALAYRLGLPCARDRLLMTDSDGAALARLDDWEKPRLPVSGGGLIAKGLPAGPIVAVTLKAIEETWIDAGFPPDIDDLVATQVAAALRDSQNASAASGGSGLA